MGKDRRCNLRQPIYAAMSVLVLGYLSGASAQSVANADESGPALSTEEVRACLCLQQEIDDLRREADLQSALHQDRRAELSEIDQKIERERVAVDVSNPEAVETLQQLVARQQMLRDLLRNDMRQSQQASAERLNARVAIYNDKCTTRPMFKLDIERARANLQCPAP